MTQPWTFEQAEQRLKDASRRQHEAENEFYEKACAAAKADEDYRVMLTLKMEKKHEDGAPRTACEALAKGDLEVAQLRTAAKKAEAERERQWQACWRRVADRKDAQRMADWSQRRDLAEGYGDVPEPEQMVTFGGKRAE